MDLLKRNVLLVALSLFALVIASGCGKDEVVPPSAELVRANRALDVLDGMEKAYKARDMKGVMGPVSPDFRGGAAGFETGVRKDMETYPSVSLNVNVDRVVESGNDVAVAFHWYGRWTDRSGKVTEGRGNTVFTFTDTGEMRLASVTGDNPFAVVR